MTLEQLKSFCAIVDHGGFRAASEALFKSQSAISIAIKKLEGELSLRLFTRDQYRPTLTNQGKALYKKALTILNHSAEFTNLAQHFSMGEEPDLRIAMSGITPIEPILNVLKATTEQAPSTQLSLQMENLNGTLERLKDDDADIAISETSENEPTFEYQHLTQVKLIAVVAKLSPFAKFSSSLSERDLEGSTQILVRDTSLHTTRLTAGVVEGTNHWIVNDFMMKKHVIISGIGWGRLPEHMV
ncbi:MAG: LysR family transcriptional regulator, partial [Mariprofundaceae bacterium]|nr:LysR family transcriptional regulator [Mariprofundaceae bacterium]